MAWEKRTVTDQNVEFPNRFLIDGESKTIEPDFGTVVESGTPINKAYLQPIEDYLETVATSEEVQQVSDEFASHKADNTAHGEIANMYRSGKDANGIFTTLEYKRTNGTLFKKSVLSGGISPKYTTRTVTYYDANGTTVLLTKVYTLTYTGDDLTSEVTA